MRLSDRFYFYAKMWYIGYHADMQFCKGMEGFCNYGYVKGVYVKSKKDHQILYYYSIIYSDKCWSLLLCLYIYIFICVFVIN